MAVCLLPHQIERFKRALKRKQINLATLIDLSTEERTKILEEYAGPDNASDVNLLIEQKLILKNRVQGLKNAISKLTKTGRYSDIKIAEARKRILEYKEAQQKRIFSPEEHQSFLDDLAENMLGTSITKEEGQKLFELTREVNALRQDFNTETNEWTNEESKAKYGAAKVLLENYTEVLKDPEADLNGNNFITYIGKKVDRRMKEFLVQVKENPARAGLNLIRDTIKQIADSSVAMIATLDNSFLGRQGLKTLMTHPTKWLPAAKQSFIDFGKTVAGKDNALDDLRASVYSNKNFLNGKYEKSKIIDLREEQFPTTIPEKIPLAGRLLKASETAFKGSALRMRTAMFDQLVEIAESQGVDTTSDDFLKDIGQLINSLTAKGSLGKFGQGGVIKLVMWSPKMLKANFDVLTAHRLGADFETDFAKKEAFLNLLKIIVSTGVILGLAKALRPESVTWDPRSADFGKIKIGNTRFDITGGASGLVVLGARLFTGKTTSTQTGITKKLGGGFGDSSYYDVILQFFENKFNPPARFVVDSLKQKKEAFGKELTPGYRFYSSFTPISVQNFINLKDDYSVEALIGAFTDIIGVSANTYKVQTNWELSESKELNQFKEVIGDDEFKIANLAYNKIVEQKLIEIQADKDFDSLTQSEQESVVTKIKNEAKKAVFERYNFSYTKEKTNIETKKKIDKLSSVDEVKNLIAEITGK